MHQYLITHTHAQESCAYIIICIYVYIYICVTVQWMWMWVRIYIYIYYRVCVYILLPKWDKCTSFALPDIFISIMPPSQLLPRANVLGWLLGQTLWEAPAKKRHLQHSASGLSRTCGSSYSSPRAVIEWSDRTRGSSKRCQRIYLRSQQASLKC